MKMSLQVKLLALCIFLVLITAISISASFYALTKQDKQRESRQRIRIAFEIIRDDFLNQKTDTTRNVEEFLQQSTSLPWTMSNYHQEDEKMNFFSDSSNAAYVGKIADELQKFSHIIQAERLLIYGMDKRLLGAYYHEQEQGQSGIYAFSETGQDTFLRPQIFTQKMLNKDPIPDLPLPEGISGQYSESLPETTVTQQFSEGQRFGLKILAPIFRKEEQVGILVGDIFYTQKIVERYAELSQTEVNLFAGTRWSVGTLPDLDGRDTDTFAQAVSCEKLFQREAEIDVTSVTVEEQRYYQGQCVFSDAGSDSAGAISVSLSQQIEQQEIAKLWRSVLTVATLVSLFAVVFSLFASRKSVHFLQQLIRYIDLIAKGDIPEKITSQYKGEFREIQQNVNSLIKAMNHVAHVAEEIANGVLTVDVQKRSENDSLMQALQDMVESLQDVTQLAEKIADGDLTVEVKTRSEKDRLMQALKDMIAKLNGIALNAKTTADHIATGGQQIRSIAEMVSQGSSQQAAAAEEASSSMQEMVANIKQNADNAKLTETMALESSQETQKGGNAVKQTIDAMKKIEERISIIQEISMQTSILSMNATIEAAKAQDYGKGFAVVASEVRNLASRSRIAAEEIEQLVKSCVNISEQAGAILERLVPNSQKTADLVQEINAASSEQYMGAEQINNAIQQLDQVIQQNAATAEEMAASSEAFTTQVEQLREAMAFFTVKEQPKEFSTDTSSGLMQALQPFIEAKGAHEEVLVEMLEAVVSSLKSQTTSQGKPAAPALESSKNSKNEQDALKETTQPLSSTKYDFEMSPQEFRGSRDEKDEEFERF